MLIMELKSPSNRTNEHNMLHSYLLKKYMAIWNIDCSINYFIILLFGFKFEGPQTVICFCFICDDCEVFLVIGNDCEVFLVLGNILSSHLCVVSFSGHTNMLPA